MYSAYLKQIVLVKKMFFVNEQLDKSIEIEKASEAKTAICKIACCTFQLV